MALPVFCVLVCGFALWALQKQWDENLAYRTQLQQVTDAKILTSQFLSSLKDGETGQRGYTITGDPAYLEPYNQAVSDLPRQQTQLRSILSGSGTENQITQELNNLTTQRLNQFSHVISLRRKGDLSAATGAIVSGEGKRTMDRIRAVVYQIDSDQALALERARLQYDQNLSLIRKVGLILAIALGVVGAGTTLYAIYLSQKERKVAALAEIHRWRLSGMRGIADATNRAKNFQDALDGVIAVLRSMFINPRAEAFLVEREGWNLVGRSLSASGASTEGISADAMLSITSHGDVWTIQVPIRTHNGLRALIRLLVPYTSVGGFECLDLIARYVQLQLEEVAERQDSNDALSEVLARQKAVFEGALDGIVTFNDSGSIESMNPAAEQLFGLEFQAANRRQFASLLEGGGDLGQKAVATLTNAPKRIFTFVAHSAPGASFPVEVAVNPIEKAGHLVYVASIRDITEQKRAELTKSEFVATVSHELRTPLTSIAGSLSLLAAGSAGQLPPPAVRLISIAHRNSERLVRLVNDILDVEKIESGKVPFRVERVDLRSLLQNALESSRGFAEKFGVELVFGAPPLEMPVMIDTDRMIQVVTNLVSNAVKFSPRGGSVEVTLHSNDQNAVVVVRDHGPGIPPEFQARIFSKFAQADSSDSREKGGTGLGLNIVKQIVGRLNGVVYFRTSSDGTEFVVELPLAPAGNPAQSHPRAEVLICCDHLQTAEAICESMKNLGLACEIASSDFNAVRNWQSGNYKIALVDVHLEHSDALDLAARLSAIGVGRPVVVFGAVNEEKTKGEKIFPVFHWIDLPEEARQIQELIRRTLPETTMGTGVVLHVDDDPDVLGVVQEALAGTADLVQAQNLEDARKKLAEITPDLVILDVGLPDGSGLDLLPHLRLADGKRIPVVIFSAQEIAPELQKEFAFVLVKSRSTLEHLADSVKRLLKKA